MYVEESVCLFFLCDSRYSFAVQQQPAAVNQRNNVDRYYFLIGWFLLFAVWRIENVSKMLLWLVRWCVSGRNNRMLCMRCV